jgi:cellulose synthase operon protein C
VARLGLRVLRADPQACAALTAAELGRLLAAPHGAVGSFAFAIAQARLAEGVADPARLAALVAALLAAPLPEARALALRRLEAGTPACWSDPDLAAALLTSPEPDVQAAVPGLARAQALPAGLAAPLVARLVAWLRAMPHEPDAAATAAIRGLRAALPVLWPDRDLPLPPETAGLIGHPAAAVAAAGLALLAQSGAGAAGLPPERWDALIGAESDDIRIAALVLLARLDDARLGPYAERVVAFASGPGSAVRQAARPLVGRLAAADPSLAPSLARALIGSLFRAAPDEAYAADVVALLREALPGECAALDDGTLWRLLQARADGARRLGAALLPDRGPDAFSVRQIARLGGHPHRSVRDWATAVFAADPARFQAAAAEAVLLVESDWPDTLAFARSLFEAWPDSVWTPAALAVVTDSVKPEVLAFARHLLRSRLRPEDTEAQVLRLLEHPAPAMHLLLTELLTEQAVASEAAFVRLIPLARIVMLQVLRGRVAKDRMAAFLRAEALRSRARAEALLPLFADLTLSGTARDRSAAILTLRDVAEAHPGLATPLVRRPPEARGTVSVWEGAR